MESTQVTADLLAVAEGEHFAGEVRLIKMADGRPAYQLERLGQTGEQIRSTIQQRVDPKTVRHQVAGNWRAELDQLLGPLPQDSVERDKEENARKEKAAALEEIAASRFSVLIGPAGTGKTTLLSVLCSRPDISGTQEQLAALCREAATLPFIEHSARPLCTLHLSGWLRAV
jgi:flagellar biosynthesis GTPase FlhF